MIRIVYKIIKTIRNQASNADWRSTSEIEKTENGSCSHKTIFKPWIDLSKNGEKSHQTWLNYDWKTDSRFE